MHSNGFFYEEQLQPVCVRQFNRFTFFLQEPWSGSGGGKCFSLHLHEIKAIRFIINEQRKAEHQADDMLSHKAVTLIMCVYVKLHRSVHAFFYYIGK